MGTNFYRVSVWGKLGETCMKFLHKGDKAFVQGDLELRTYKNKEGVNTPQLSVNCTNIEFLNDRRNNNDSEDAHAYTAKQTQNARRTPTTDDEDQLPF